MSTTFTELEFDNINEALRTYSTWSLVEQLAQTRVEVLLTTDPVGVALQAAEKDRKRAQRYKMECAIELYDDYGLTVVCRQVIETWRCLLGDVPPPPAGETAHVGLRQSEALKALDAALGRSPEPVVKPEDGHVEAGFRQQYGE